MTIQNDNWVFDRGVVSMSIVIIYIYIYIYTPTAFSSSDCAPLSIQANEKVLRNSLAT